MATTKKTLIVDSTQIAAFLECPQAWIYNYRMNIVPRIVEPKEAMMKGSFGHKLLELYYKRAALGGDLSDRIKSALDHDIDKDCNCTCGHSPASHSNLFGNPMCKLCSGTKDYFHTFEQTKFPLPVPIRQGVIDKFRMYAMTYSMNDFRPHSAETVEVGFSERIYEDSEHLFILEGKIDLLGSLGQENIIVDHKFQERAHTLYKKSIQFRNYSMVTGTKLMVINYIRMSKSADKPFERALVSFTKEEHFWWKRQLIDIMFRMIQQVDLASKGLQVDQNWKSCNGQWGKPCDYTDLCEERDNEAVKLVKIKNNFTKKEEWRPW